MNSLTYVDGPTRAMSMGFKRCLREYGLWEMYEALDTVVRLASYIFHQMPFIQHMVHDEIVFFFTIFQHCSCQDKYEFFVEWRKTINEQASNIVREPVVPVQEPAAELND